MDGTFSGASTVGLAATLVGYGQGSLHEGLGFADTL